MKIHGNHAFLEESKYNNLPRVKTIQNPYSLLNRLLKMLPLKFVCAKMWAYSPMAFGILSGKF
jgi:aryl-alcohol dehydrogenase-like predicted oxidoreductase